MTTFHDTGCRYRRSGYEYMATLTGRDELACRWIERRIGRLLWEHWAQLAIVRMVAREMEQEPWNENLTDEGDIDGDT